ncbi:hypothetical protein [Pseudomonas sp. 10S4]|uniref:hypothetical protein n=1 Tax=Pseudomonas sp. 10S4 TaxID=3048583 RepID=UPI002AC9367E|nr:MULTISPECIES: hypothetical protein [unclassified Pseudomonas]MEB0223798.1 hypothetical protein [Pseudomonas sp. 5S1]MEB0292824.1 hypothetical protein [Pseudomonas sp. 10S4]WPX16268.1 hypothetical protein RHM58_19670 [Pseudomonas sp. 10S4]
MESALFRIESNRKQREAVIEKALSVSARDAAFLIQIYNVRHTRYGQHPLPEPIAASEIDLPFSDAEIKDAMSDASHLIDAAYDMGDAFLGKVPDLAERELAFREAHPGFSEASYWDATDYGCFLAR